MEVLVYLIVWSLLGLWGYKIMEKKNRDGGIGVILGVLLGFIGIIICYCMSDKNVKKQDKQD